MDLRLKSAQFESWLEHLLHGFLQSFQANSRNLPWNYTMNASFHIIFKLLSAIIQSFNTTRSVTEGIIKKPQINKFNSSSADFITGCYHLNFFTSITWQQRNKKYNLLSNQFPFITMKTFLHLFLYAIFCHVMTVNHVTQYPRKGAFS